MRELRTIKMAGLGIVGASLLLTAAPTAFAADVAGGFSYGTANSTGGKVTIKNPVLDRCYPTKGAASGINETNLPAQVFRNSDCTELATTLAPGQSDNMITFASVKFTDQGPMPAAPVPAADTPIKP